MTFTPSQFEEVVALIRRIRGISSDNEAESKGKKKMFASNEQPQVIKSDYSPKVLQSIP